MTISVAQLGVGYWGPNLLRNLLACKRCTVSKVVDVSTERRKYFETTFPNVPFGHDPEEIFNDPSIDAVIISTPASTHYSLAERALKSGKHILVEKPLANSVEEVEKISIAASQNRRVVMAGHTFVYHPAVHYLRDAINQGELGQVRYIYSQRLNLGRIRSDTDALWNLAPHDVSIVQFLLGDPMPMSVSRHGMDYVQRGIDDVVFLNITYPNRVMANFHVSWLDPNRTRKVIVVGSEKMAIFDDTKEKKVAIYDKGIDRFAVLGENMDYDSTPSSNLFTHRSGKLFEPEISSAEPLKVEIEHFLDCIEHGTDCWTGLEHARKVVKILCDAKKKPTASTQLFRTNGDDVREQPSVGK